jgi:hypothetical protein
VRPRLVKTSEEAFGRSVWQPFATVDKKVYKLPMTVCLDMLISVLSGNKLAASVSFKITTFHSDNSRGFGQETLRKEWHETHSGRRHL